MSFNVSYNFDAIDNFSPTLNKVNTSFGRLNNTISKTSSHFKKITGGLSKLGRSFSLKVGAPIAAFGTLSVRTANQFDASMNMVKAVTGATGEQFDALRKQSINLGRTTQFTARQAASAQQFLGMAGFKTNQILAAMPKTLQLAASAQLDMGSAADIVTNIMTGYGAKISDLPHVNDVLVKTFTQTNTNLVQLGQAMKMVGPIAHTLNIPLEQTSAALGLLGQAGIQGGMAGTMLRRSFIAMVKPTAEAKKIMGAANLKFADAHGHLFNLTKIIKELQDAQLTAAGYAGLFGVRAGPAMAALVNQGSDSVGKLTKQLQNSSGIAKKIAKTQMMGLPGALRRLTSGFESFQIGIVDANNSLVVGFLGSLTKLLTNLNNTSPAFKKIVGNVMAFGIIIGPTLMGLAKFLIILRLLGIGGAAGLVIKGVRGLGVALKVLSRSFGWIGLIITVITLLVVLYKKFALVRKIANTIGKFLAKTFSMIIFPLKETIKLFTHLYNLFHKKTPANVIQHRFETPVAAPRGFLGTVRPTVGGAGLGGTQQMMSTLNINVNDPTKIIKSMHGESTADQFSMPVGQNMSLARV